MKLKNVKSTFPMPLKVLYGTTYILCAVILYFALFFADFSLDSGLPAYATAVIAGVTLLMPLVLMPLIYALIGKFRGKTLGRYHASLILSTLAAAIANAALSNIFPQSRAISNIVNMIFSLFAFSIFLLVFVHSCISIGDRLGVETEGGKSVLRYVFALVGIAAFCAAVAFLPQAGYYTNLSYIMSIYILLAGLSVYLTTFTGIPKFIAADKKQTPQRVFASFYAPMKTRYGIMSLFSIVFSLAAVLLFLANHSILLAPFTNLSFLNLGFWILAVCGGALLTIVLSMKVKNAKPRIKHIYMAVMSIIMAVAAVLMLLTQYVPFTNSLKHTFFLLITALTSVAAGGFVSIAGFSLRAVRAISGTTKGKMFSLTNVLICALFGAVYAVSITLRAYIPIASLSVVTITSLIIASSVISLALYMLKGKGADPADFIKSREKLICDQPGESTVNEDTAHESGEEEKVD